MCVVCVGAKIKFLGAVAVAAAVTAGLVYNTTSATENVCCYKGMKKRLKLVSNLLNVEESVSGKLSLDLSTCSISGRTLTD